MLVFHKLRLPQVIFCRIPQKAGLARALFCTLTRKPQDDHEFMSRIPVCRGVTDGWLLLHAAVVNINNVVGHFFFKN